MQLVYLPQSVFKWHRSVRPVKIQNTNLVWVERFEACFHNRFDGFMLMPFWMVSWVNFTGIIQ
jgi:hypothetical protein